MTHMHKRGKVKLFTFSFEQAAPNILSCAPKIFSCAPTILAVRLKIYIGSFQKWSRSDYDIETLNNSNGHLHAFQIQLPFSLL